LGFQPGLLPTTATADANLFLTVPAGTLAGVGSILTNQATISGRGRLDLLTDQNTPLLITNVGMILAHSFGTLTINNILTLTNSTAGTLLAEGPGSTLTIAGLSSNSVFGNVINVSRVLA